MADPGISAVLGLCLQGTEAQDSAGGGAAKPIGKV